MSNGISSDFHADTEPFYKISNLKNYYYIEKEETISWYAALHKCHKFGCDLMYFENKKEFNVVTNELKKLDKRNKKHYWIDMTNLSDFKEFRSISTGLVPRFVKWYPREPNNKDSDENCAELVVFKSDVYMNDNNCTVNMRFICKTKLPRQVTIIAY